MMKKRIVAMILAALMLGASLCACGTPDGEKENDKSTSAPGEQQTEASTDRKDIPDDLPDVKFGGKDFVVLTCTDTDEYITVDGSGSDVISDAVYNRNATVLERFGAKVTEMDRENYADVVTEINKACLANSDDFHMVMYHVVSAGGVVTAGNAMDWYDFDEYINFEKPWWSPSTVNDLTLNNHCYIAIGDFDVSAMAYAYCMFYNRPLLKNYGYDDLYDTVENRQWTFEKMLTIVSDIYTDTNQDNKKDAGDFYGLSTDAMTNITAYVYAFNNPIFKKDAEGELQYVYYTEKLSNIVDNVVALVGKGTKGVYAEKVDQGGAIPNVFSKGNSVMSNGYLQQAIQYLGEIKDYAIIPYPLYDENQEQYYSMADGRHGAMLVCKNISESDKEFIGVTVEALCAESYKQVLPKYYDVALKNRYANSPRDAAMIDLIVDGRIFDFGYVFDNWQGVAFVVQNICTNPRNILTSKYKTVKKSALNHYKEVFEAFEADPTFSY